MKYAKILSALFVLSICNVSAQNTFPASGSAGIGTITPNASALLEMVSISKGLLAPRMTKTQRDAIAAPATGLMIYQTNSTPGFYYYSGTAWTAISAKGANTSLSNLVSPTAVNQILQPNTDNIIDLGTSAKAWKDLYLKGGLYFNGIKMWQYRQGVNTIIGENAGSAGAGGYNTAIGTSVLSNNTTGNSNVAVGENSLVYNTTGSNNTATGYAALINNNAGSDNVANGFEALYNNTTGSTNIGIGSSSLFANTTGFSNIAVGVSSLTANTTGVENVAVGSISLRFNTTGNWNSAFGNSALLANITGSDNIAIGDHALAGNTSGNNNIAMGSQALRYNTGSNNTAAGKEALYSNLNASQNSAFGYQSLYLNTTGVNNVAVGYSSLKNNTTGEDNVALGSSALSNNTTGVYNTASGYKALLGNTTADNNTATGAYALNSSTTGSGNTAFGSFSLNANAASDNAGFGNYSLYSNTNGTKNTATGGLSLYYNTNGTFNTANGYEALYNNTDGALNTAIGTFALYSNTTGNTNTAIGHQADVRSGNLENATAIGYYAKVGFSNMMMFGNSSVTDWGFADATPAVGYCLAVGTNSGNGNGAKLTDGGTWTNASDKNLKEDFQKQDAQKVLDKINKLEITKWKYKGSNNEYHIGPMAQDFFAAFKTGIDDKSISTIDPSGIALLGIQALSKKNNDLEKTNNFLSGKIDNLLKRVEQLEQSLSQCCSKSAAISSGQSQTETLFSSLEQNIPNPFNRSTTINYTLPAKFSSAKIIVTDNSGKTIKQFTLSTAGKGAVSIAAGTLASGLYHYALYVEGKMVENKKMEIIR